MGNCYKIRIGNYREKKCVLKILCKFFLSFLSYKYFINIFKTITSFKMMIRIKILKTYMA